MQFLRRLFECFFVWRVAPREDCFADAQVIIACSMGDAANRELARITTRLHERFSLPLILQWEIADNMPHTPKAGVVRTHHRGSSIYLDTYEVLAQAAQLARVKSWQRAILLAHPDHIWRVIRVAEKLGFRVVGVPDTSTVPYDPPWNHWKFMSREIFYARPGYLFKGYI